MDRRLSYIDANPDILDILLNGRFALEGLAKVAEAVFGQSTVVAGFTCAPTSPASMTVNVGPGQVYQMAALESTAISALGADTHQVLKQGVAREITPLTLVAPTTVGTAVNVLIEVAYVDDKTSTQQVYNYYNAANPDIPLTGVGGNNLPQTSIIRGAAQIQTKYGVPATAGSQTTPSPDAGFAPLFVVTLTQGQTAISGNIATAPSAPFVADALQNIPAGVQANKYTYVKDTGAVNALVVAPVPALASRPEGTELLILPKFDTTSTTPTISDGLGTVAIFKRDGTAPAAGDIKAGIRTRLVFDGTAYRFAGSATSDAIGAAQAAKSIFNVCQFQTTTRVSASGSTAGSPTTVWSGITYTKRSATSLVLCFASFQTRINFTPGAAQSGQYGAAQIALSIGGSTKTFGIANSYPAFSYFNSFSQVFSGLSAGDKAVSVGLQRPDALAWTNVFNPVASDESHFPTPNTATLIFAEVEP